MRSARLLNALWAIAAACGLAAGPENPNDPQLPPASAPALTGWLQAGHYQNWHCEAAGHSNRPPSPHGRNRICSNDLLSGHGDGEYPVGAASVKEILGARDDVTGHAVLRKMKPGADESFFWLEILGTEVAAEGDGTRGVTRSVCVGCHRNAGSDAQHSGHDFIFTQVR